MPRTKPQTVMPFAHKPRKPKRGSFFVCMKRKRVYGRVRTVRNDRTFKRTGPHGVVIDSRKRGATWESVQLDDSGEYRFVMEVPEGFSCSPGLDLSWDPTAEDEEPVQPSR